MAYDDLIVQLAKQAGLHIDWINYRGEPQRVETENLRTILQYMQLPANTLQQVQQTINYLQAEKEKYIPAMIVGSAGKPIIFPPVMQKNLTIKNTRAQLKNANGDCLDVQIIQHNGFWQIPVIENPGYYTLRIGAHELTLAISPAKNNFQELKKSWALAVQVYALRRYADMGIGNYTALADAAELAAKAGASGLVISPVHALFSADVSHYSPYSPSSRLFLNVFHVDVADLIGDESLRQNIHLMNLTEIVAQLEQSSLIDWPRSAAIKLRLLKNIWDDRASFLLSGSDKSASEFQKFRHEGGDALEAHASFEMLHAMQFNPQYADTWSWRNWPEELRNPHSVSVKKLSQKNRHEVDFHIFLQWLADRGLAKAQSRARNAGMQIGLIADLAVGTEAGGSHAWSHQEDLLAGLSVGAPPDLLNVFGQNWGLTSFSPHALQRHGYAPFLQMLRACLRHAGGLRIDHVLGLKRLWLVPEGCDASQGAYLQYPFEDLLNLIALEAWQHQAVIIGEDLGTVPEGFRDHISQANILGMQVLWFERDYGFFIDPSRWSSKTIATTSTHDLPTVAGWWSGNDIEWRRKLNLFSPDSDIHKETTQRHEERAALWSAFKHAGVTTAEQPALNDVKPVIDAAVQFVSATPSPLMVLPVEDVLGVTEQANIPGTIDEHPNWKRRLAQPLDELFDSVDVAERFNTLNIHRRSSSQQEMPRIENHSNENNKEEKRNDREVS